MKQIIIGEQPFQVDAPNFSISPSSSDYDLQVSADGYTFSKLLTVSAGDTKMVVNVSNGAFYKLLGNEDEITVNWVPQSPGASASGGEAKTQVKSAALQDGETSVTVSVSEGYDGISRATISGTTALTNKKKQAYTEASDGAQTVTLTSNGTYEYEYPNFVKSVTTEVPVVRYSHSQLTQDEYDALSEKDANTIYVIGTDSAYTKMYVGSNEVDWTTDYLCMDVEGSMSIALGSSLPNTTDVIEYSLDRANWTKMTGWVKVNNTKVWFRGVCPNGTATSGTSYCKFLFSGDYTYNLSGNLNSLVNYQDMSTTDYSNIRFGYLFTNSNVVDASKLELPATTVGGFSYISLFADCASLVNAPDLIFTTITGNQSCKDMFKNCTSLIGGVTALLPTTLKTGCYYSMFEGCTSLTSAPEVYGTTPVSFCYRKMFTNCTSLTTLKLHLTSVSTSINGLLDGNTQNGTIYVDSAVVDSIKTYVPSTWTITTL